MQEQITSLDENVESSGRVESLVDDLAGPGRTSAASGPPAATSVQARADTRESQPTGSDVVVLGSGNLGLVYLREAERRDEDSDD